MSEGELQPSELEGGLAARMPGGRRLEGAQGRWVLPGGFGRAAAQQQDMGSFGSVAAAVSASAYRPSLYARKAS